MAMSVPSIDTERLVLRQWRPEDRDPFAALNADPAVMEHFPSTLSRTQSDEMVDRIMAAFATNGWGLWATEVKDTGAFIGFIGLAIPRFEASFTPCVEVGWRLAQLSWGHGYAPEGAAAALQFAFEEIDLPDEEVVSFTTVANSKSRRVMDKIGLVHDPSRDFDHPLLPDWSGRHHVLYATTREKYSRQ